MKLKTILKNVNRRYQRLGSALNHESRMSCLSTGECSSTFFSFTRKLRKELKLERYSINNIYYYTGWLYDIEISYEYTNLRFWLTRYWWESIDIFNHRGWIDEETGELFGNRWGIRNNSTGEGEEFDIFGEFKCYFEKNYASQSSWLMRLYSVHDFRPC